MTARGTFLTGIFSYEFTVLRPNSMETTGVNCSILATASPAGTLPDVTGGTCEQSSRTFTVTRNDTGLTLSVTQPDTPSSNLTGAYTLPSDELVYSDEPNAVVESYTGPTSFDLNYVPVIN